VISSARLPRLLAAGCVVLGLFAAACSDDGGSESTSEAPGTTTAVLDTTTTQSVDTSTTVAPNTTAEVQQPLECTASSARACLLPWPNDAFTVADPTTATGRRLSIPADGTPRNAAGAAIDVTDQNRADGFSPGSAVLVDLPGLDPVASGLAPSTDIGASLADDAPIRITDTVTGERWPYFAELDAQAADDADRLLMIHPAVSLTEGHTYEVSIGDLVDVNGDPLVAPLSRWTFTVASADSLSGRVRAMRDDAYASLVDAPPSFAVTDIADRDGLRIVDGTIDVPNYLSGDGSPGATMLLDDTGSPVRSTTSPTYPARFHCVLPAAPAAPVPVIVYGHGLLGDRNEVEALSFAASIGVAGACATDWIGMTGDDIGNVATILADLSRFPEQADRMQQGLLNFQLLGRALNDERAFAADPAFQTATGDPIIAPGATQFVGNSQGGILGGAASAVSTEWQRVVLGVPGINYSLLLHRSSDWPQFQAVFDTAYANAVDRVIALQLIQLLWDRGENNGYVQHLTADPYPGISAKQVLLVEAFGDHQVSNVSTEVLARTIGARAHTPAIGPGRSNDRLPHWGIEPLDYAAVPQASLIMWDFGTPAPPTVNLPPTDPEYGRDPHGAASAEPRVLTQAVTFLLTGTLSDACGGAACTSDVMTD
jgi:hypothetical protein